MDNDDLTIKIRGAADEREDIQKKTFSKWINSRLARAAKSRIGDLVTDLQDGSHLLALLEVLSGHSLQPERGRMRVHHLNNVNRALRFITESCNIKLVNISADDIVNGNAKLILGLVWSIILHWQVKSSMQSSAVKTASTTVAGGPSGSDLLPSPDSHSSPGQGFEQTLLAWCRQATAGYASVHIRDLTTSFRDGLAFNAIIHHFRPELFDYSELVALGNAEYSLAHAFQVAHDRLGIDRLLDPEDMMVPTPDKKSVMMYLTCMFQALPHVSLAVDVPGVSALAQRSTDLGPAGGMTAPGLHRKLSTSRDSPAIPPKLVRRGSAERHGSDCSGSSLLVHRLDSDRVAKSNADAAERESLASSVGESSESSSIISVVSSIHDVGSFTQCLENTLAWLLGARETFDKMEPISDDVEIVKQQFRVHEDYLVELTRYQENVGALLQKGNEFIAEGELTAQQEHEARSHIELLNRQWEDLRVHATERQSRLQHTLMELQQAQLDELSQWLADVEQRIAAHRPVGENLDEVKKQVEEHRRLQEELEEHQAKVNSLQNMVVVVEDSGTDSSCVAMETQLEQLGYRWADVCKWTEDQWLLLQDVDVKWNAFKKEKSGFDDWLSLKEEVLGHMQLADITEPRVLVQQVQHLKNIEHGMDEQMQHYDVLNGLGQSLVNYLAGFPQTSLKIQGHLDEVKERWDNLVRQMEAQSKRIAQSGVDPAKVAAAAAASQKQDARAGGAVAYVSSEYAELRLSFCEWLERTSSSLEMLTALPSLTEDEGNAGGQLSIEEQLVLVRDVAEDVRTNGFKTWTKLSKLAASTDSNGTRRGSGGSSFEHTLASASGDVDHLEKQWESVKSLLARTESLVTAAAELEQVTDELNSLQESLSSYQRWLSAAPVISDGSTGGEAPEIARQLDQCRVKLKAMGAHEKRVESIYEKRETLVRLDSPRGAPLAEKVIKLYTDWQFTLSQISSRQQALSLKMNQAPPKKYLDAVEALLKWIKEVEDTLLSEKAYVCDMETMEANLTQYKEMQDAVKEHSGGLEYINKTGRELVEKTLSTERATALREQLQSLNARWDEASCQIELRVAQLQTDLDDQRHFRNQLSGLSRWMSDMDQFLRAEQPLLGDTEALEAQLKESDGALDDVRTLQTTVEDVARLCARLSERAESSYAEVLLSECAVLKDRWQAVCVAAQLQNANLKAALAKSMSLTEGMSSLTEYLTTTEGEVMPSTEFNTLGDLQNTERKLKKMYSEMCSREALLQKIKAASDEMLSLSRNTSLPRLVNRVRLLENKLKSLKYKLEDSQSTCTTARANWDELISLLRSEYEWLEKLHKKLRMPGLSAAVDVEEVCEEMDDLENCVENHSEENHLRIKDLAKYFYERNILANEAETKLKEYEAMYASNVGQARDRIAHLEKSVQQMQARDAQAANMEVWMKEVSGHLRRWRDQDLLAGDLPQDFQLLVEEFAEQDKFLASLKEQVEEYRRLGRAEAADRLANREQTLRAEYDVLVHGFNRFQRPADFDGKFDKVIRQLSDIDSKIFLIELHEETPEHVQSRLEQCNKFYRTMSEMKQEVEYIIKAGRQVVEKKQVDFPHKLSQQLDAAKQQYNDLGAQITQAKRNLEKALKVSKKLAREMTSARELVERVEADMSGNQADDAAAVAALTTDTRQSTRLSEVKRGRSLLDQARELMRQLEEYTEEGALENAQASLAELERRIADLAVQLQSPDLGGQRRVSPTSEALSPVSQEELTVELALHQELAVLGHRGSQEENRVVHERVTPEGERQQLAEPHMTAISQQEQLVTGDSAVEHTRAGGDLASAPALLTSAPPTIVLSAPALSPGEQLIEEQLLGLEAALSAKSKQPSTETEAAEYTRLHQLFMECETAINYLEAVAVPNMYIIAAFKRRLNTLKDQYLLQPRSTIQPNSLPVAAVASVATKRDSTADRWQRYEALTDRVSLWLTELERKLAMALPGDAALLEEIKAEIAKRQIDMNSLNDEVEILTERDTPPMDRKLQPLNQRWVAIRAQFAALDCPASQGHESSKVPYPLTGGVLSVSVVPSSKHDYAVVSKPQKQPQPGAAVRSASLTKGSAAVRDLDAMIESLRRYPNVTQSNPNCFGLEPHVPPKSVSITATTTSSLGEIATFSTGGFCPQPLATSAGKRFSCYPGTFVDEMRTVLQQINIMQQQLDASQITPNEYTRENFASSGDILKSIWQTMAALSGTIGDAEAQHGAVLSSQDCDSEEAQRVTSIMQRLRSEWAHITAEYNTKNRDFQETCALWQRYQNDYRSISQWLDSAEKTLRRSRTKSPPSTPSSGVVDAAGRSGQQELEDEQRQHETEVDALCILANHLAARLHVEEAERFVSRLDALVNRSKAVLAEMDGRRSKFAVRLRCLQWKHWLALLGSARLQSIDKEINLENLLENIDDLMFWCDETEVIMTTGHVSLDVAQLSDQLQKIKARLAELPAKANQLGAAVTQLRNTLQLKPQLTNSVDSGDLQRIETDLAELSEKWCKVHRDLLHRQKRLTDVMSAVRSLTDETVALTLWLESSAAAVNDGGEPVPFPSQGQLEIHASSAQSLPSVESLSAKYRELVLGCKRRQLTVPLDVEARFLAHVKQCANLRQRLQQSSHDRRNSDTTAEETAADAAVQDGVLDACKQAMPLECSTSPPPTMSADTAGYAPLSAARAGSVVSMSSDDGPLPPPRIESLQPCGNGVQAQPVDSPWMAQRVSAFVVTKLEGAEQIVKGLRVVVGDIDDVIQAQVKLKGALCQLQEATQQFQTLTGGSSLTAEKAAALQKQLESVSSVALARQSELERMLADSRRLDSLGNELQQGLAAAAALPSEMTRWQENYSLLARMTEGASQAYASDDTSRLHLRLDGLSDRLQEVSQRRQRSARDMTGVPKAVDSPAASTNIPSSAVSADDWATVTATCQRLIDWLSTKEGASRHSAEEIDARRGEVEHVLSTGRSCLAQVGQRLSAASSCDGSTATNGLSGEHSHGDTIKRMAKDARHRLRQLGSKWADALGTKRDPVPAASAQTTAGEVAIVLEELEVVVSSSWRPVGDLALDELEGELCAARAVRQKLSGVTEKLDNLRGGLSKEKVVDQLKTRVVNLSAAVGKRINELESATHEFAVPLQGLLSGSVHHPYERTQTANGVPYYINHDTKKTQWDHPAMARLSEGLSKYNDIKFSAYRTALKLRTIQKGLGLDSVALHTVAHAFDLHKLDARDDRFVGVDSIGRCLRTLFEAEDEPRGDGEELGLPQRIDLALNWLLNIYDLSRHGCMRVLSFKVAMVLMSRAPVEEKFKYLFRSLDSGSCIDQRALGCLLGDCLQLPRHLGESAAFGGHCADACVRSCMEQSAADAKATIDVDPFLDWLRLEPQPLVWIDVFHRVAASEKCVHNVKCSICKASPIIGLRYRCVQCFNFSLCQSCFFTGKRAKKHSAAHPMKEYYSTSTSNTEMKDSTSPLRKKKFSSGRYIRKHLPKGYLPVKSSGENDSSYSLGSTPMSSPAATLRTGGQLLNASLPEVNGKKESLRSEDVVISTACSPSMSMSVSSQDIHMNISKLAQQLDAATLPSGQKTSTPLIVAVEAADPVDDEHSIIAHLSDVLTTDTASSSLQSPVQIVKTAENNQKLELEAMIRDLEEENRKLQEEYDHLRTERDSQLPMALNGSYGRAAGAGLSGASAAEMLAEAKQLRQHKSRLEMRMQILEDHNRQLEAQLQRLRHLLVDEEDSSSSSSIAAAVTPLLTGHDGILVVNSADSVSLALPPAYEERQTAGQLSPQISVDSTGLAGNLAGTPRIKHKNNNVSELFQRAGDIGKALGSLVNTVTQDEEVH